MCTHDVVQSHDPNSPPTSTPFSSPNTYFFDSSLLRHTRASIRLQFFIGIEKCTTITEDGRYCALTNSLQKILRMCGTKFCKPHRYTLYQPYFTKYTASHCDNRTKCLCAPPQHTSHTTTNPLVSQRPEPQTQVQKCRKLYYTQNLTN
uniref:Uncharacterized protein n=1 Tax=Lygus hesperus TaxID=30085 RepID=A0A146LSA8_LYGHE